MESSSDDEDFLGFTRADLSEYDSDSGSESDISVSESDSSDEDTPLEDLLPLTEVRSRVQEHGSGDYTALPTTSTGSVSRISSSTPAAWDSSFTPVSVAEFTQPTGPTNILGVDKTEVDFFSLLFPEDVFDLLTDQTNLYAHQCQTRKPDPKWKNVTKAEMKAFIGIHVVMSVIQLPAYKCYWNSEELFAVPSIPNIMSRDRFDKILQYMHCNDSTTNPPRGAAGHDKIHHVRPIFDRVQQCLMSSYRPHKSVSIDEAMIPFRGRISFRQYIPAKPCKYGVKVWELADSTNGYIYQMQVYTGKSDTGREHGLASRVVWDLTRQLSGKYYHVYMDNYFSCPSLFQDLLQDGIYAVGTCRQNRKGWPDRLHKNCLDKRRGECKAFQKGNLVATSWYDNRQVNFLSTNSDPQVMVEVKRKQRDGSRIEIQAPEVVALYGKHMNGVDHADQLRMQYSTSRRSKKFWKYMFWFLVDTAIACGFILMKESPNHVISSKKGNTKPRCQLDFRRKLAQQLIGEFRRKRRYEISPADRQGRSHWPYPMPKSMRCRHCLARKIRKESKYGCVICGVNLCVECFEPYHQKDFPEE